MVQMKPIRAKQIKCSGYQLFFATQTISMVVGYSNYLALHGPIQMKYPKQINRTEFKAHPNLASSASSGMVGSRFEYHSGTFARHAWKLSMRCCVFSKSNLQLRRNHSSETSSSERNRSISQ